MSVETGATVAMGVSVVVGVSVEVGVPVTVGTSVGVGDTTGFVKQVKSVDFLCSIRMLSAFVNHRVRLQKQVLCTEQLLSL